MATERKISILLLLKDRLTKPITASGRALRTFRNNARQLGQTLGPLTGRIAGLAAAFAGLQTVRKSLQLARVQVQAQAQLASALRGNTKLFDQLLNRAAEFQSRTTIGDEEFIKQAAQLAISLRETGFEMGRLGDITETTFQVAAATGRKAERVARQLIETLTLGRVSIEVEKFFPQLADLDEDALRAGAAFDVLREGLGGTAEALAATDFGRVTQQANLMGDLFERLGIVFVEIQADIMPKLVAVFEELVEAAETEKFKGLLKVFAELAIVLVNLLPTLAKLGAAFVALKTAAFVLSLLTASLSAAAALFALLATGPAAAVIAIGAIVAALGLLLLKQEDVAAGFTGLFELFADASFTIPEKIGFITDELAIVLLAPLRTGEAFVAMSKVIVAAFKNIGAQGILFAATLGNAVTQSIAGALLKVALLFDAFTKALADSLDVLSAGSGEKVRTNLVAGLQVALTAAEALEVVSAATAAATAKDLQSAKEKLVTATVLLSKAGQARSAQQLRDQRLREVSDRLTEEADDKSLVKRKKAAADRVRLLKREADLTKQLAALEVNENAKAQERITAQTLAALQDRHRRGLVLGSTLVAERIKLELEPLERSIELAEQKSGTIRAIMDSFAEGDAQRVEALQRLVAAERTLQTLQLDRVDVLAKLDSGRRSAAEGAVAQVRAAAGELAVEQKRLEASAGLGGISIAQAAGAQAEAVARFQEQVSQARAEVSLMLGDPQYAADADRLLAELDRIQNDGLLGLQAVAQATGEGISTAISGSASPALAGFFQTVVDGTASAKEAFEGFLSSLTVAISNFIAESIVQDFLTLLTGVGGGGLLFGAQGLLPGAGGGLLGGGAAAVPAVAGGLGAAAVGEGVEAGAEGANIIALTANTTALGLTTGALGALTLALPTTVGALTGLVTGLVGGLGAIAGTLEGAMTILGGFIVLNTSAVSANTIALAVTGPVSILGGGGRVPGPPVRADIVSARLTPGEWVLRQRAASYYGQGILQAMNQRLIPRELFDRFKANVRMAAPVRMFQAGGSVGPATAAPGGLVPAVVVADDGTLERLLAGGENAIMRFFEDHAPQISALMDRHRGLPI